jgi:hypothetical protein
LTFVVECLGVLDAVVVNGWDVIHDSEELSALASLSENFHNIQYLVVN